MQVTLIQIDNYGPWTTTPTPRPEPDLQALQGGLYADLSELFGARDAYVFYGRFDNVVAVTNGLNRTAHERIQDSVNNRYPVSVSMGVGRHRTPADALSAATEHLQTAGSAQDADRRAVFRGEPTGSTDDGALQVAHFDVVDATDTYTDRVDAFTSLARIERTYVALLEHLHDRHGALTFFVGGDNFIAVCPDLSRADYRTAVDAVGDHVGVDLRVGVGRGSTAVDAGMDAKVALETCRDRDCVVEGDLPAVGET